MLSARVRSLLRYELIQHNTIIKYGDIKLDTRAKNISVKGLTLCLTLREHAILEYLLLHQGKVISAEELIEHVWDSEANMFTNAVYEFLSKTGIQLELYICLWFSKIKN